jgi:hypothetical protein
VSYVKSLVLTTRRLQEALETKRKSTLHTRKSSGNHPKNSGKSKEDKDPKALAQKTKDYNIKSTLGDQINCEKCFASFGCHGQSAQNNASIGNQGG